MTAARRWQETPDQDVDAKLAWPTELEATAAVLRHDLRRMLPPVLLPVDQLLAHSDPKVVKTGQTVLMAIKRAKEQLVAMRARTGTSFWIV